MREQRWRRAVRHAREALDILFEADVRRERPLNVLEARIIRARAAGQPCAIELVRAWKRTALS
jgi:hypothetical protein